MRAFRSIWIPLIAVFLLAIPAPSSAQVSFNFVIDQAPPPLPVYNSIPQAPYQNYMWTPGYWAWGSGGYYWVPGTWVQPPQTGLYWTPGYWGYSGSGYGWNSGYWANQVGYYGGINYGFGYPGTGFYGGRWQPSGFSYNTAVWPVNRTVIHNTYIDRTVIHKTVINRTSYNGGKGGVRMSPDARELQVMHEHHVAATSTQTEHASAAERDRNTYSHVNAGKPAVQTAPKPYDAKHPPEHAQPVTSADKAAAKPHVMSQPQGSQNKGGQNESHKPPPQPADNKKPPAR